VVPYSREEITAEAILQAVAREYFYPILAGKLVVTIEGPELAGGCCTLGANSLLGWMESDEGDVQGDLRCVVDLAIWAHRLRPAEVQSLTSPPARQPPTWSDAIIPQGESSKLADRFAAGKPLALQVPLAVPTADGQWRDSFFRVIIEQDLKGRGYPPVFIREGIIVPKALERRVRGHHLLTLVIIDDKPIATLLADAETPAHTQWSHQTQNFRDRYQHGKAFLDFVRSAPRRIAEILSGARKQRDALSLAEFFPRAPEEAGLDTSQDREQEEEGTGRTQAPHPRQPAKPQAIEIEQSRGGFRIKRGDRSIPLPARLEITVAYDRSHGNPLRKYHRADFRLESMAKRLPGVREMRCRDNRIVVDPLEDDFRIEVTGFDENRDVYVRAQPKERDDD
jgi:hypothetical protein